MLPVVSFPQFCIWKPSKRLRLGAYPGLGHSKFTLSTPPSPPFFPLFHTIFWTTILFRQHSTISPSILLISYYTLIFAYYVCFWCFSCLKSAGLSEWNSTYHIALFGSHTIAMLYRTYGIADLALWISYVLYNST